MDKNINDSILPHHIPEEFCSTRAAYRQGKKLTAVKVSSKLEYSQVYTVSKESSHLLIFNVPAINLSTELQLLCERYGKLAAFEKLAKGIELEEFTEVFHVNYLKVPSARYAKKYLDNRSFYGGFLHVCYAPERETFEETRIKLITRRNEIAIRTGRKVKTKTIIPTRFNNTNKKRSKSILFTDVDGPGTSFQNEVPYFDYQRERKIAPVPASLIPAAVFKKRMPTKEEPPKKIPRIIFYKNSEPECL